MCNEDGVCKNQLLRLFYRITHYFLFFFFPGIFTLILNLLSCYGYKRVCYYTNWSQYRKGIARFVPENIDVNICTHLIYAFAKLDGNQLAPVEWNDDTTPWNKGM